MSPLDIRQEIFDGPLIQCKAGTCAGRYSKSRLSFYTRSGILTRDLFVRAVQVWLTRRETVRCMWGTEELIGLPQRESRYFCSVHPRLFVCTDKLICSLLVSTPSGYVAWTCRLSKRKLQDCSVGLSFQQESWWDVLEHIETVTIRSEFKLAVCGRVCLKPYELLRFRVIFSRCRVEVLVVESHPSTF
jgi:hypothetical protein